MSAIVSTPQRQNSTHVPPNTTFQNTTLNIRKAMKRLFKSSSSSATNTATTTVPTKITITPTSDDVQGRSRLSYTDDCGSSRRGKSLDGRPSLDPSATNGLAVASSSVIHLGLPGATSEGPPPSPSKLQSPPSSFRSKFRPKSLQGLKTKSSSDNGSTRHQRQQQLRNPSSELLPSSSPPPPLPHVNAVPNGIRPSASADESSKSAASIAKANTQPQPPSAIRVNGSASSETQRKTMASAKTSTSASDRLPVETRSHAISAAPPSAITSTPSTVPPSEVLGVLNAAYKPNTPNPRETTANHMATNVAPTAVTASFTDGPVTAEPVEQQIPRRQEEEEEEGDQKKQQPHREGQVPPVAATRSASDGPTSSDLTSRSRSGSPASPPSPPHRRAGSDEFQRPRAYTTGDAALNSLNSSPPPSAVSTTTSNSAAKSGLRLRVDSAALPPRLPSLPVPSTSSLAQEFSALASSVSPTSSTVGALNSASSPSSSHPATTPHPPGAFHHHHVPHHHHTRSMTLPSSPISPLSPRRVQNASTPGTYVMPMAADGAVTMKMNPSLVMSRPMVPPPTPGATPRMRFGSLLVSGVSSGEREGGTGASEVPMGRSRAASDSRNSPPRPMRGALPALRRDGSSFYMNMTRSGASTGSRTPAAAAATVPLPAEDDDEGDDDDDDDIIDEDAAMGDDAASDDDGSDETPSRAVTTPLLGGMAKAARAMGLPFGSGSAGSTPGAGSTPKANPSPLLGSMTMTASSYFRPRHTLDAEEGPVTPTPRQRSGSTASASHRMSLVASGAPSGGLGTVQDDNDEEERQTRDSTPLQTPRPAQEFSMPIPRPAKPPQDVHNLLQPGAMGTHSSSPTSHRTSLYQTPLPTPTPSAFSDSTARETIYFDAESGGSDAEVGALMRQAAAIELPDEQGMGSAFTTFTLGSTSTLTATVEGPVQDDNAVRLARPTVQSTASAATVKPESSSSTAPVRPEMPHSEGSGSSGGSRVSALGLDLPPPAEEATVRATRSGSTASQDIPQHSQRGRAGIPPPDYFISRPSTGSTEHPSTPGGSDMLRGMFHAKHTLSPRTPGGRPAMYTHQVSHSMLDFGSMGMGGSTPEDEVEPPLPERMPSVKGKGKEREGTVKRGTVKRRSPSRTPKHAIRRRSLPDMSGLRAPPPPYPKFSVREEEGKEVLPPYTCRVHFEASVMRKMEFDHPGMLAKDRSWKRVYVVLNGTTLRIFKQNPRMYPVRPVPLKVGVRKMIKEWPPGGKNGDGIVHVDELVLGAPHVHLPEELLPRIDSRGVPLKKVPTQGSGGSGGAPGPSNSSRRSMDSGSRQGTRRSFDIARRGGGTSRSSMSSSSNLTTESSTTAMTSPVSDSTADLLLVEDSEKGRPQQAVPGPSAILGATRPSNSQSAHRSTKSQLLASIQANTVLRQYTLQGAETGLASDYHKRKNVIRVRAEGEQFLIEADNVFMAIDWIETFQAGANVATDLDERPMPKVPALPRRRRRRRTQGATEGGTAQPTAAEADIGLIYTENKIILALRDKPAKSAMAGCRQSGRELDTAQPPVNFTWQRPRTQRIDTIRAMSRMEDTERRRARAQVVDEEYKKLERFRIERSRIVLADDDYERSGGYGIVRQAELHHSAYLPAWLASRPPQSVAVKQIQISAFNNITRFKRAFTKEVSVWSNLGSHPGIAKFLGFHADFKRSEAWLLSPWEPNGNISEFTHARNLEVPEKLSLVYDTIDALSFLHGLDPPVCHGDLKSANVLVSAKYKAVLCDFGLARLHEDSGFGRLETSTGFKGSLRWCSPEVINGEPRAPTSDVYSWAWLVWEIMTGKLPYEETSAEYAIIRQIFESPRPQVDGESRLSDCLQIWELMTRCWKVDPQHRPTARMCNTTVTYLPRCPPKPENPDHQPRSAELLENLGDLESFAYLNEAMSLYRAAGDTRGIASVLRKQAAAAFRHSDYDEALRTATTALEHCRNLDDALGIADASFWLGWSLYLRDADAALPILHESLEICRTHGNDVGAARSLERIGEIHRFQGRNREALSALGEAMELASRSGDQLGLSRALLILGNTHFDLSDFVQATEVLSEAATIARNIGWDSGVINSLWKMGRIKSQSGDYREAEELFQESISIARRKRERWELARALVEFGKCLQRQSKLDEAALVLEEPWLLYQALSQHSESCMVASILTGLRISQGEWDKALFWYDHIIAIRRGQRDQEKLARSLEEKGGILVRAERYDEAALHFEAAIVIRMESGYSRWWAQHRLVAIRKTVMKWERRVPLLCDVKKLQRRLPQLVTPSLKLPIPFTLRDA